MHQEESLAAGVKDKFYILLTVLSIFRSLVRSNESQPSVTLQSSDDDHCPPWFFYNVATEQCECYRNPSTKDIVIMKEVLY